MSISGDLLFGYFNASSPSLRVRFRRQLATFSAFECLRLLFAARFFPLFDLPLHLRLLVSGNTDSRRWERAIKAINQSNLLHLQRIRTSAI